MKAGTNPNHTLAVISFRQHDEGAYLFGNSVSDYFGRHMKLTVTSEPGSAAQAANQFFTSTLRAFQKYKPKAHEPDDLPLLYFDPTYRPTSARWLDDLQASYYREGAPMVFGNFGENGVPVGPIVLSRNFRKKSSLLDFLPENTHWRSYLAWELSKNSVKASCIGSHESAILQPQFEI